MKKLLNTTSAIFFSCVISAWAIPTQITYQGTLKEKGVPANGVRNMVFRLTNSDGTVPYWTGASTPVNVNQGLFSTVISPTNVDWQNATPYIEVSIEGQALTPREPVTATIYSAISATIVDGAVSKTKLDPMLQDHILPSGLIGMFAGPCPTGWTRFVALDNRFAMGGESYGAVGGNPTHSHSLITSSPNVSISPNGGGFVGTGLTGDTTQLRSFVGGSGGIINLRGSDTNEVSNIPPYVTLIFCQKQ